MPSAKPSYLLDYLFMYSYPIAFVSSIVLSMMTIFSKSLNDYLSDNRVSIGICVFVAVSGFVSLIYWFENSNIAIVNNLISSTSSVYNINTVKASSTD